MGYETTLIIARDTNSQSGYHKVEASIELGCVANGHFGALLDIRSFKDREVVSQINQYEQQREKLFIEGEYTQFAKDMSDKAREEAVKEMYRLEEVINRPYIFWSSDKEQDYTDKHGDPLIVASVEEVYEALIRDQAKMIYEGTYGGVHGYPKFEVAIALLSQFRNTEVWKGLKVILYGH